MKTPATKKNINKTTKTRGFGDLSLSPTVKTTGTSTSPRTIHTLNFFSKEEAPGGEKNRSIFRVQRWGVSSSWLYLRICSGKKIKMYAAGDEIGLFIGKKAYTIVLLDTHTRSVWTPNHTTLKRIWSETTAPERTPNSPQRWKVGMVLKPSK